MSYEGKRVVVTGCYSGVGEALVNLLSDLGAEEIIGLDIKEPSCPVTKYINCDMGNPDSVDAAAAEISGPVHVLFNNAGIAANLGAINVMKVNVFGLIRLTKALEDQIPAGGSVINTASIAGMNWPAHQMEIMELLSIDDWDKQLPGPRKTRDCGRRLHVLQGVRAGAYHDARQGSNQAENPHSQRLPRPD